MEQQRQADADPRFDQARAEEALLLAARMQQTHQGQFSLHEMKQTAAEAGIAPEFVDQAVWMLAHAQHAPKAEDAQSVATTFTRFCVGFVVFAVQMGLTIAANYGYNMESHVNLPIWFACLGWAAFLSMRLESGRDSTRRGLSYLAYPMGCYLAFLTYDDLGGHYGGRGDIVIYKFMLLFALQVAAFLGVRRWLKSDGQPDPSVHGEAPTQRNSH